MADKRPLFHDHDGSAEIIGLMLGLMKSTNEWLLDEANPDVDAEAADFGAESARAIENWSSLLKLRYEARLRELKGAPPS